MRALRGEREAEQRLAGRDTIRRFLTPSTVPGSSRALGWDLMRTTSSCGTRMSPSAFGHTGFTGTSMWIDPALDFYAVLLTNRVHPIAGPNEPM
jgi:CubicO group peptidase (beta-lactamase class C family)